MKEYTIDISSPKCWNEVVLEHLDQIKRVMEKMRRLFRHYMSPIKLAYSAYKNTGGVTMYEDEIEEISKILGITPLECLLFQLSYELCSACTSAILKVNGKYLHFRTMDWDLPELKPLTIKISVYRGTDYLFDAITWAGCIGIFTGIKKNRYTISLNYRRNPVPDILSNIYCAFSGHFPSAFCIRHLLESDMDPKWLEEVQLIAPAYYTVMYYSEENKKVDGYVLVRDRCSVKEIKPAPVVQTNCDRIYEGSNIVYSFQRLEFMNKYVDKDLTKEEFKEILRKKFPIINDETIYRCVMSLDGFACVKVIK
jgi:hypothetical protein